MKLACVIVLLLNVATWVGSRDAPTFDATDFDNTKTDIVICTDCGVEIDDQWMILHLLRADRLNVSAIFSSHCGSYDYLSFPQAESSMRKIVELLNVLDNEKVPVFVGSNYPLGTEGSIVDDTADEIYQLVMDYSSSNRMTIVLSGPATDVAGALIKYPQIEDKIRIVATAFQSKQKGMSFNVANDIAAWQVILDRDVPITVCPGPLAGRLFRVSRETVSTVLNTQTTVGAYLYNDYTGWIESNKSLAARLTGREDTWPIWDEVIVSHLLGFTQTETCPRPTMLDNGDLDYSRASTRVPIEWIIDANTGKTWEHFRISLK